MECTDRGRQDVTHCEEGCIRSKGDAIHCERGDVAGGGLDIECREGADLDLGGAEEDGGASEGAIDGTVNAGHLKGERGELAGLHGACADVKC